MCLIGEIQRRVAMRRQLPAMSLRPKMDVAFLQLKACAAAENPCRASHVNGNIASLVVRALTDAFVSQSLPEAAVQIDRKRKPHTDTMTRAMHTEMISAQGITARGIGACAAYGMRGFPNSLPKSFGTDATT